jgi:hypothetical protein
LLKNVRVVTGLMNLKAVIIATAILILRQNGTMEPAILPLIFRRLLTSQEKLRSTLSRLPNELPEAAVN